MRHLCDAQEASVHSHQLINQYDEAIYQIQVIIQKRSCAIFERKKTIKEWNSVNNPCRFFRLQWNPHISYQSVANFASFLAGFSSIEARRSMFHTQSRRVHSDLWNVIGRSQCSKWIIRQGWEVCKFYCAICRLRYLTYSFSSAVAVFLYTSENEHGRFVHILND